MYPEITHYEFSFEELHIAPAQLEEIMGYMPGESPAPFPEMIDSALKKGPELCRIRGSLAVSPRFTVDEEAGIFSFEDQVFHAEGKMLAQLSKAEGAAVFICTAGPEIGRVSKQIMAEGDFMEGYVLDLLGSITVGATIDKIQDMLTANLENKAIKVTNRYSPGHCNWSLTEQQKIFSIFPENHCEITLSDSFLMDPIKSVTGIIGFGPHAKKLLHECELCDLTTCVYRDIRLLKMK